MFTHTHTHTYVLSLFLCVILEQPVAPTDVRPMFEPQGNISLLLNPVKTGKDMGNEETMWMVHYKWLIFVKELSSQNLFCPRRAGLVQV